MQESDLLTMLKANLEIVNSLQDTYLTQLTSAALGMVRQEGIDITLPCSAADGNLVVMYAAWLYRKRAEDNPVMPRMLRFSLNNRKFAQVMGGGTDA